MSKNIGFTRWYDRIPELSQAVRQLEKASSDHQHLICQSIVHYNDDILGNRAYREGGLKKLGTQKVMGLLKSKSKRRWYDQDPLLHRAFNDLYMMDDTERYRIAIRVLVALEAMQAASLHPDFAFRHVSDHTLARSIVQGVFKQHMDYLMEKIAFFQEGQEVEPELPAPSEIPETAAHEEEQPLHDHLHDHSREHVHGQPERFERVMADPQAPVSKRKVLEAAPNGAGLKIASRAEGTPIQTLI